MLSRCAALDDGSKAQRPGLDGWQLSFVVYRRISRATG